MTIGELSEAVGVPAHVLRYWESRFPQLRPLTRAGNRRFYRPEDVALVKRIHTALSRDGYTVKGVQRLLDDEAAPQRAVGTHDGAVDVLSELRRIRDDLRAALQEG